MPPKKNPLKLNTLQLKTLAIFQELSRFPETSSRGENSEEILITNLPHPHGNHFHCGDAIVLSKDASGLRNEGVWKALERKGLIRSMFPLAVALSAQGQAYEINIKDKILHRSDH